MSTKVRIDWRGLDRASLDHSYDNAAAVPDSSAIVALWNLRSAALRRKHTSLLDIVYGPRPRNRIDLLEADVQDAPTLIFLHGGYWQMRSKESFTFTAAGPLAAGMNVALVGYTLAPEASMGEMVAETRAALDCLTAKLPVIGADPSRMILSGWSAGAHLAAAAMDHPSVGACVLISGIYDLEPMRFCFVNDKLGLDEVSAQRYSPLIQHPTRSPPLVVIVGAEELPLMVQQSSDFAKARMNSGQRTVFREIADANHFTVLDHMERPDGQIVADICQAMKEAAL